MSRKQHFIVETPSRPFRKHIGKPASPGFTLVEMVVKLAVLGILLTIAVPSFLDMLENARISSHTRDFAASLYLARSEALKRGAATLCPSTTGSSCAGGKAWENGWIVFADANANGVVNPGETVLLVKEALAEGNTIRSGSKTRVTYHLDGYPQGFNDSFRVCDTRGTGYAKTVVLSNAGRIRITTEASQCP